MNCCCKEESDQSRKCHQLSIEWKVRAYGAWTMSREFSVGGAKKIGLFSE